MFNPEEKDTIAFRLVISSLVHQKVEPKSIISVTFMSFCVFFGYIDIFRVDYERQSYYYSEPIKEIGRQSPPKDINKVRRLLNPWASHPQLWNKIFLASCVVGVSMDPLFLYVLVINKDGKCLAVDQHMKDIAVVLRTATDFFYIFHIIFRLRNALAMARALNLSVFTGLPWSYLLIDVLAILPLPQVIKFIISVILYVCDLLLFDEFNSSP